MYYTAKEFLAAFNNNMTKIDWKKDDINLFCIMLNVTDLVIYLNMHFNRDLLLQNKNLDKEDKDNLSFLKKRSYSSSYLALKKKFKFKNVDVENKETNLENVEKNKKEEKARKRLSIKKFIITDIIKDYRQ